MAFLKKVFFGYLIFVAVMLLIAAAAVAISSATDSTGSYQSESLETTSINVNWATEDQQKQLMCEKFWNCTYVEVQSAESCEAIMLEFDIKRASNEDKIADATSYGGQVYANEKQFFEIDLCHLILVV